MKLGSTESWKALPTISIRRLVCIFGFRANKPSDKVNFVMIDRVNSHTRPRDCRSQVRNKGRSIPHGDLVAVGPVDRVIPRLVWGELQNQFLMLTI